MSSTCILIFDTSILSFKSAKKNFFASTDHFLLPSFTSKSQQYCFISNIHDHENLLWVLDLNKAAFESLDNIVSVILLVLGITVKT